MGTGNHDLFYKVFIPGGNSGNSPAPPTLCPVSIGRNALDITKMRHRNYHIFFLDQRFKIDFVRKRRDFRTTFIIVFILNNQQFFFNNIQHQLRISQNCLKTLNISL